MKLTKAQVGVLGILASGFHVSAHLHNPGYVSRCECEHLPRLTGPTLNVLIRNGLTEAISSGDKSDPTAHYMQLTPAGRAILEKR